MPSKLEVMGSIKATGNSQLTRTLYHNLFGLAASRRTNERYVQALAVLPWAQTDIEPKQKRFMESYQVCDNFELFRLRVLGPILPREDVGHVPAAVSGVFVHFDVAAAFAGSVVVQEGRQPLLLRLKVAPLLQAEQQLIQSVLVVAELGVRVESVSPQRLDLFVGEGVDDELDVKEVAILQIKNLFELE